MDENTPTTSPLITQSQLPIYRNKFVIVFLIIFFEILYTFVLLNISKPTPQNPISQIKPASPSKQIISEDELPIGIDLLKNPIVYQWRGSVEGTLIAKDEESITLSSKGAKITIPLYAPSGKRRTPFNNSKGEVDLKDIPLGTNLRGDFFVIPWPNDKNKIVGSLFTVEEKAP